MRLDLKIYQPQQKYKRNINNELMIFSRARRKWFIATPEEICRQCLVSFLEDYWHIPVQRIAEEKKVMIVNRPLRVDLLVYDDKGFPLILIEVKSPQIELDIETVLQLQHYYYHLKAPYLFIANGRNAFFWQANENGKFQNLEQLPDKINEIR